MTLVPLTQAAHHLGIDVKTVRRWLAEAQLPVPTDPHDARKKGVYLEHIHLLATQHQRCLTSASPDLSAQEAAAPTPLSAAVVLLPQTLEALHEQITALQQQIATLTQLLKPPPAPPVAPPTPPAPPEKTRKPIAKATPATPPSSKSPAAAKAQNKPVHVIPRVEYRADGRYVVICPKKGLLSFEPDTEEWFAWVKEQDAFRFVGRSGHFTAHHEWRVPKGAWRAYRHIRNHNHIVRLAPNQELTIAVLEHAAEALQAHLS